LRGRWQTVRDARTRLFLPERYGLAVEPVRKTITAGRLCPSAKGVHCAEDNFDWLLKAEWLKYRNARG
jgi:hypothetical protein